MKNQPLKTSVSSASSRRPSRIRRALYEEDLDRARLQAPSEKLKIALDLSELCYKLKRAIQSASGKA